MPPRELITDVKLFIQTIVELLVMAIMAVVFFLVAFLLFHAGKIAVVLVALWIWKHLLGG